jgi:hypothetical protein
MYPNAACGCSQMAMTTPNGGSLVFDALNPAQAIVLAGLFRDKPVALSARGVEFMGPSTKRPPSPALASSTAGDADLPPPTLPA